MRLAIAVVVPCMQTLHVLDEADLACRWTGLPPLDNLDTHTRQGGMTGASGKLSQVWCRLQLGQPDWTCSCDSSGVCTEMRQKEI